MKLTDHRCQCAGCGEYFNSVGAFEKHRVGDPRTPERRCRTTDEMIAAGMSKNAAGWWITRPWGR